MNRHYAIFIILVIVALISVYYIGFYKGVNSLQSDVVGRFTDQSVELTKLDIAWLNYQKAIKEDMEIWSVYKNTDYGFSIAHHPSFTPEESRGDLSVIAFVNRDAHVETPVLKVYDATNRFNAKTIEQLKVEVAKFENPENKYASYRNWIDSIGGFDVVLSEGHPGYISGSYDMHVLFPDGRILDFHADGEEYDRQFRTLKKI